MEEIVGNYSGREKTRGRRRVHFAYVAVMLVIASAVVVYDGLHRTGTGSDSVEVPLYREADRTTTRPAGRERMLRLGVFNIASGVGKDRRFDLKRTSQAIEDAGDVDVLSLHEVAGSWSGDQAQTLAYDRKQRYLWAPTEVRWWHCHFGNGLLFGPETSPESAIRIQLPQTQERGWRNVVVSRVRLGEVVVTVLATHVDRQVDQAKQLEFLTAMFASTQGPAVLMGDMNVTRSHPAIRELIEKWGAVDATGPSGGNAGSSGQLELILVKGLVPVAAGAVENGASDHPLVWADVAVPK